MTGPIVAVGAEPPPLVRTIEAADMVAYAGATWDWHRLHYDPVYLAEHGLDRPVVDGQVFGAHLAEQIQDWLGPAARLRRLRFRFAAMVFAGETVRVTGKVTEVLTTGNGAVATIAQRVTVPGDPGRTAVKDALAEVLLPGTGTS